MVFYSTYWTFTCYSDGAFQSDSEESEHGGVGVIVRNEEGSCIAKEKGRCIAAFASSFPQCFLNYNWRLKHY